MDAPTDLARSASPTRHRRSWRRSRPLRPTRALPSSAGVEPPRPAGLTVVVVEHGGLTPTSLPDASSLLPAPAPRLRIGLAGEQTEALRRRLAPDWAVSDAADPLLDLAVVRGSDPACVARLCAEHPGLAVLAVVPADAAPELAVRMLTAGADGCLRGGDPGEVSAHLRAMSRRVARRPGLLAV